MQNSLLSSLARLNPRFINRTITPGLPVLFRPISSTLSSFLVRGFKVRTAVKKFCSDCYMVRRKGRVYVYCKSNKKHKQRQG
ncbi:LAMI_0D09912g1_1 [Lachancea mirantina]|uniref:Ribosomal protein n=1 Tax=Lachancea mirantina TaxID=1230905 RepID=A0A1G4JDW8_9SACH|nr:LAMI_0D09912g1_1 [Lachancea mirantina]